MNALSVSMENNIAAEQSLIGGLMIDVRAWDRIADLVSIDDFYRDDHRRIFRHIALIANSGKAIDTVTVCESIEKHNEVEQAGGFAYLIDIANSTASAANIRRHAELVRERARLRRIQAAAARLQTACEQPGAKTAEEIVAEAETAFAEIIDQKATEPADIEVAIGEALSYIDNRTEVGGLRTGFKELDVVTGGLEPGQLVIVAARPSMGKTAFGCNVADDAALSGHAVLVLTMEMTRREIAMRILSARSGVPMHEMRSGTREQQAWEKLIQQGAKLQGQRLWIDDTAAVSVAYVKARAKRLKRTKGLDLIVIDYLGLMRGAGDNRTQEIGSITRGLKAVAKELGVPIIVLAQLNRGVEGRTDKRPLLSDLRDSGEIEQDADIVAMLHRESYYNPAATQWEGIAELLVRKNRNGPTGEVLLTWIPNELRFGEYYGPNPRCVPGNASRKHGF